jgi:drug/metabolite transporter (DMT)-like permease
MVFFWSVNFVIGKYALNRLPALFVFGLRTILAGVFILPMFWWQQRRNPRTQRWAWREVGWVLAFAICGVPLNQLFFVLGLSRTSVSHGAIAVGLTPILVLLFAAAFGQERITAMKLVGMGLALAGVAALESGHGNGATPLGDFGVFLSSLVLAAFTVAGKKVSTQYGGITIFTFAYVGGGLAVLPLTIWEASHISLASIAPTVWLSVAYMALFPAVISYLLYYYALTYIAASRASVAQYLQPLMATGMAVAFLGENVTASLVTGGAMVLTGVAITERS